MTFGQSEARTFLSLSPWCHCMIYMDISLLLYQLLMAVRAVSPLNVNKLNVPTWNASSNLSPGPYFLCFFLFFFFPFLKSIFWFLAEIQGASVACSRQCFPDCVAWHQKTISLEFKNPSGCSLETAPRLRRVTLKCHFLEPKAERLQLSDWQKNDA